MQILLNLRVKLKIVREKYTKLSAPSIIDSIAVKRGKK